MRFLWLDINSSFSHSSLAIPSLDAQLDDKLRDAAEWSIVSGTTSAETSVLISQILFKQPDVLFSTLWLFNSLYVTSLLKRVKALLPDLKIILGGPEFLGDNINFLKQNKDIYAVIRGDGEKIYPLLVRSLINNLNISKIEGVCLLDKDLYIDNGKVKSSDISEFQIPEKSVFYNFNKPFVQIETSRGCFNTCKFCISGCKERVYYVNYESLKLRFQNLIKNGVKEVRILDRTFNAKSKHASELLKIMSQFEGKLRFHLEIHPAFISDSLKRELEVIPSGMIHAEAGIQSLDENVLKIAGREGTAFNSLEGLKYLAQLKNIEVHADLIAGLPGYTLTRLFEDFSQLAKSGVDEIQVELLKVIPGTEFRHFSNNYKLKFSPIPQYEVLESDSMSFSDLIQASILSRVSDLWYNDSKWRSVFVRLINCETNFLNEFISYLSATQLHGISPEKCGMILYEFLLKKESENILYLTNAWLLSGFSTYKGPGKLAKKWEVYFKGNSIPFDYKDYSDYTYFVIDVKETIFWYSYHKSTKALSGYISLNKTTNIITDIKLFK